MDQAAKEVFQSSFREVLAESGFPGATVDHPPSRLDPDSEVLCSVGLAGGFSGFLMLSFANGNLRALAKRMAAHSGIEIIEIENGFQKETAAELANQLAGRAVNGLAKRGIDCSITPPTIVSGSSIQASLPHLADKETWEVRSGELIFRISVLTRKK